MSLALLCLAHGLRSCSDRAWAFVLPVYLAQASPGSLRPISAVSLAQSLGVVLLAPLIARAGPRMQPRWMALLVVCENVCVLCGGAALLAAGAPGTVYSDGVMGDPRFWAGAVLMAVDGAISSLLSLVVEKDYVRRTCGGDVDRLAAANAAVMRTDLGASVGTYALLALAQTDGALLADPASLLAALAAWHCTAACATLAVLALLRRSEPALAADGDAADKPPPPLRAALGGLREGGRLAAELEPGARRTLCAFVALFFTVLSPSGLLTAHLRSRGVGAGSIATFRSAAQAAGCLGTVAGPPLIKRLGVGRAGAVLQRLQLGMVVAAALAVLLPSWPRRGPAREAVLMGAVAGSRVGLWGFDLCERALLQLAVPAGDGAVLVFNFERALAELAGFGMLGLSLAYPRPDDFGVLVGVSAAAVCVSSAVLASTERLWTRGSSGPHAQHVHVHVVKNE